MQIGEICLGTVREGENEGKEKGRNWRKVERGGKGKGERERERGQEKGIKVLIGERERERGRRKVDR